jgi:2-haloacid dehalogenase
MMRKRREQQMADDRWVTFDCFGTLVDWRGGWRRALSPIAGARIDALIEAYHVAEGEVEVERPHRLYKEVLRTGLQRGAERLGIALTDTQADVLSREWGSMRCFDDVGPALGALRAAGWKLAMLTNCDVDLFARTLETFPQRPDLVVTAEEVGSYKPALGHFEHFERQTGVARANWIHAACSWIHDIVPARSLGLKRIWIDRDRSGHDPAAATRVLPNVVELPRTVAEIA